MDETAVVFLNKYPVLYGYTLLAPRQHREHVPRDFTREAYLALQGNSHIHWHLAPLPPGVPLEKQQFEALRLEKGVLALSEDEMASLAARIREEMGE